MDIDLQHNVETRPQSAGRLRPADPPGYIYVVGRLRTPHPCGPGLGPTRYPKFYMKIKIFYILQ